MTTDGYRIDKLDNYDTWCCKMKFLLITKKLWLAIEPESPESDRETRSSSKEAFDKSAMVRGNEKQEFLRRFDTVHRH